MWRRGPSKEQGATKGKGRGKKSGGAKSKSEKGDDKEKEKKENEEDENTNQDPNEYNHMPGENVFVKDYKHPLMRSRTIAKMHRFGTINPATLPKPRPKDNDNR